MQAKSAVAFHLAFPVNDLEETRAFYVDLLGCRVGRQAERWIDFDFYGHQISAHVKPEETGLAAGNAVDGKTVPTRHFGLILHWQAWQALADRLTAAKANFIIKPYLRFEGEVGEQGTFFVTDPSGNALEFKTFKNKAQIFAS